MDITYWISWFLQNLRYSIENSNIILEKVKKTALFWAQYHAVNFNDRQRKILQLMLDDFQGNLTTTKWAKICKCSQDTATRDINELLENNVLKKEGKARNTHYVLLKN